MPIANAVAAFGALFCLALGAPGADTRMLDAQQRDGYAKRLAQAHVTLRIPRATDAHHTVIGASHRDHRGFLLVTPRGLVVVTSYLDVKGHSELEVRFHDGSSAWVKVPALPAAMSPPLVMLAWREPAPAGLSGLAWSKAPSLGAGRRAWLLEYTPAIQQGAQPNAVIIDAALGARAAAPMARYWRVALQSVAGAPLLDAAGEVLCVAFRAWGPRGSLCAGEADAFRGLET